MTKLSTYPGYIITELPTIDIVKDVERPDKIRGIPKGTLQNHKYIEFAGETYTIVSSSDRKPTHDNGIIVQGLEVLSLDTGEVDNSNNYNSSIGLYDFSMNAIGKFDKVSKLERLEDTFDLENTTNKLIKQMMFKETQNQTSELSGNHIILSKPKVLYKELVSDNTSFYEKADDDFEGSIYWSGLVLRK